MNYFVMSFFRINENVENRYEFFWYRDCLEGLEAELNHRTEHLKQEHYIETILDRFCEPYNIINK